MEEIHYRNRCNNQFSGKFIFMGIAEASVRHNPLSMQLEQSEIVKTIVTKKVQNILLELLRIILQA